MPVSLFSPLARGFGAWTGELHLAENDKGPGPSLPSLLQDDPYCNHSGVTVTPRAKSAVSAFSAKTARGPSVHEARDGELLLPKTYITRKGALVLFSAPDDPANVELSERDQLFLKRSRKKLLKNRHSEYSNQIGSVQRLAQSVLSFGDEKGYEPETSSVTDPENKVYLKFLKDDSNKYAFDKHSRPGGNIDMYLNDLLIRSGTRPATAMPAMGWGSSVDVEGVPEVQPAVEESMDGSQSDLLSVDSERLVRGSTSPVIRLTPDGPAGRSPSARGAGKKLSAEKLASSLKSGGFLGRQTILEEIDSMSEASSRPYTPASSMSRPSTRTRPYARPLSGQPRDSPVSRKSPMHEKSVSELESEMPDLERENSFARSNTRSKDGDVRRGSSALSGPNENEAGKRYTDTASRSGSYLGDTETQQSGVHPDEQYEESAMNSYEDILLGDHEIQLADEEIQGIVYDEAIATVMGETIETEQPSSVLRRSSSQVGSRRSSQYRRHSRTSSVQSFRRDSPKAGEATAGVEDMEEVIQDEGEELYLSEDAEEEEGDWEAEGGNVMMTPVLLDQLKHEEIGILSSEIGQGTFSFDATIAYDIPESESLVQEPVLQVLSKQVSLSDVKSERPSTGLSSVSHLAESRPQSIARAPSTALDEHRQDTESAVCAADGDEVSGSKSSLVKSDSKSQVTESGQPELQPESSKDQEVFVANRGEEERSVSVASSHSGVESLSGGKEEEEPALPEAESSVKGAEPSSDDAVTQNRAGETTVQEEGVLAQTEALDEAATELEDRVSIQPSTTEALPDYLTQEMAGADRAASATESVHRPASSYTSSVTNIEELPPEPGVTEVRITPRSSAHRERTTPVSPDTATNDQIASSTYLSPTDQQLPEHTTQPQQIESKASLPAKALEEKKPMATSTKSAEATASQPAQVKKEPIVQTKTEPKKPTHMVEIKPEEKIKPVRPPPAEKKAKVESQKKPALKPEIEKKTPAKEPGKPEKDTKAKEEPKPTPAKPAKSEPSTVKSTKVKAEKKEPKLVEPEKPAEKKEFTKVFDITNYEQFEKDDKKTPALQKQEEPVTKPKEIKPESLLSDTKAEISRLFGTPPVKRESAREKKERMRKELGPRPKKPKPPAEPKPPKKTAEEKELEELEKKVMGAIGENRAALETEEGGGLTVEEMALEQQLLQEKLRDAEVKLTGREDKVKPSKSKTGTPRDGKKKGKQKSVEEEQDLTKKREELREAKKLEKQKRLDEAKRMEKELRQKEDEKKKELEKAKTKTLDLDSDIQAMQQLAEEAELAEESARQKLQEVRKQAREEREKRRREEQERKKEDAIRKKNEEKARREAGRKREQEMLMRLATKEERLKIAEEERRRKEEEEEKAMADEEEEERLQRKKMEEEEARIAELERQAEEEALSSLVGERDEALMKKREMEEKKRALEEEEEAKKKEYEAEQKRIEEMRVKHEEEEARRKEEEKKRLMEFQRLEEEARQRLKQEMERRREALLRRREQNLERRSHLDGLKGKQGITKPWVFSYYVHWPRETYESRMGGADDKKKSFGKTKSAPAKGRPTLT